MVNFTARELQPTTTKQCLNCTSSQNLDCVFHRKYYECRTLFTWDIETGDWNILDYGDLVEVSATLANKRNSGELNTAVKKMSKELSTTDKMNRDIFNHLRVLDSCSEKSKDILKDFENSIEFYRSSTGTDTFGGTFSCYSSDQSDFE